MFFKTTADKIQQWEKARKVEKVIKALSDKDEKVKRWAVQALARLRDLRALEPLLQLRLNVALRPDIEKALTEISRGILFVAGQFSSTLMSENEQKFMAAVPSLLATIGRPARPVLIENLKHSSATIKIICVAVIGMMQDVSATWNLLQMLKDSNPSVREQAVKVLAAFGNERVEPVLLQSIQQQKEIFSPETAQALRTLNIDPKNPQDKLHYFIAMREFKQAAQQGSAAVELLVKRFEHEDPFVRTAAVEGLAEIGKPALDSLQRLAEADQWIIRELATRALIAMKDPSTLKALIQRTGDNNAEIGKMAKAALQTWRPQVLEYIQREMQSDRPCVPLPTLELALQWGWRAEDAKTRMQLALMNKKWDEAAQTGKNALKPLLAALEEAPLTNPKIKVEIIYALGTINAPEVVPALEKYLADEVYEIRRAVIESYKALGRKSAVKPLENALGEEHDSLRQLIVDVLAELGAPQWQAAVRKEFGDFLRLSSLGSSAAVTTLICYLSKAHWAKRKAAAEALLQVAKEQPKLLWTQWTSIHALVTVTHQDSHADVDYNRSSDCSHDDSHSDAGIGLQFPAAPPKGTGREKTDF